MKLPLKIETKEIAVWKVVPLLLASGLCALIYQVVWLREMRLIFGSSTAASGVVLAVFMGGLGVGAAILGRRADRVKNPLALYGLLELGIGLSAMLTPFLLQMIHRIYIGLGGVSALGLPGAMFLRLFLSVLVLAVPTIMIGGTLPAVVRAVETDADCGRRDLGFLYGVNTLGGVVGVVLATFLLLEAFGNRATLWFACLINIGVAVIALYISRSVLVQPQPGEGKTEEGQTLTASDIEKPLVPAGYIYMAALVTGFVFLLMELVWYRMLVPLLGGSTYAFGLILAVALAGIGIGGGLFGTRRRQTRTNITAFALICGLEAFFIAIPYGLGDRIAITAVLLKPLDIFGLPGHLVGWAIVTLMVVLLPAIMAGIQFPMLIGLFGQGGRAVGRQTGSVYGWNTVGAILGSLAGGFGLIPLLSAPGCWQLVVVLLALLAAMAVILAASLERRRLLPAISAVIIGASLLLLTADGPSAAWRYSKIGVEQPFVISFHGLNSLQDWLNLYRRITIWEQEGVESGVSMSAYDGLSFAINGKPDGHSTLDAFTQVWGPLVGAILHPDPKQGLVIGLGTGSSAGWLAEVDTMEQVDVVELEPAVLEVARRCAPVNFDVMAHPKVRVIIGDGREVLLTGQQKYDVIFSEPSNPYRSGIASLYTREFYQAVADRLAEGGVFSQWVQAYRIDNATVRTIIATLASVFSDVEIWMTGANDMLFVCSMQEKNYSVPELRQRLAAPPFQSALYKAWGVTGLEGFLAGFVGGPEVARQVAEEETRKDRINTDDRMLVEFGIASGASRRQSFSVDEMWLSIRDRGLHRPKLQGGDADWQLVDDNFFLRMLWTEKKFAGGPGFSQQQLQRASVYNGFVGGNFSRVLSAWQTGALREENLIELVEIGEALADAGDERAITMAARVRNYWPATAVAIVARYHWRQGDKEQAYDKLAAAFTGFRTEPWQMRAVIIHSLHLAMEMSGQNFHSKELFELLSEPFSVYNFDQYRKYALTQVAQNIDCRFVAKAFAQLEPHVPWDEPVLRNRLECYQETLNPLADRAEQELQSFLQEVAPPFFGQ